MNTLLRKYIGALALLLVVPGLLFAQSGIAQDATISGTVIDGETQEPLPGATVVAVEPDIGAATAADGSYELTGIPAGTVTLRVSFVGYDDTEREVEVAAGETLTADFELMPTAEELREVVVTGVSVGTEQQRTGFQIDRVGEAELQEVPGIDPANALRAKTPGARIVQASGQPGTAPDIRLRGTTTLSGSQEPLVVVDGAITAGGLTDIDMQAVESIEIVKGAAAASLYGSLAGNGVIQVITQRGAREDGTTNVTVRNEVGFNQLANTIDLSDHHNKADPDTGEPNFRAEPGDATSSINPAQETGIVENEFARNFDQQEQLFTPNAFFSNFVSVSSRQGDLNYLVSFENLQNDGVVDGVEGFDRQNIRVNLDNRITDEIEVSVTGLYSNSSGWDVDEQGQGSDNLFYGALLAWPDLELDAEPPEGVDAPVNPFATGGNAANPLYRSLVVDRDFGGERLLGNFQIDANVAPWLTLEGQFSYDQNESFSQIYEPRGTFPTSPADDESDGFLSEFDDRERLAIANARAIFTQDFGDLSSTLTASYTYEDRETNFLSRSSSDFRALNVPRFGNTPVDQQSLSDGETTIRSEDIVGNLRLEYMDRYILDGVVRQERVSLFGPDARDQTYWRLGGTYLLTEDFDIPNFDEVSLRANVGTSGSRPPFSAQYETFSVGAAGITKEQLGNRLIEPAEILEYEIGTNISLFGGRAFFEGTFSEADAANQVLNVPLSASAGFNSQFQNAATVETNTWEFAAGGALIDQEDLILDIGVVFDRTRQTVTELDRPSFQDNVGSAIDLFRVEEGEDLGVMYGNELATSIDDLRFDNDGCLIGETGTVQGDCLTQDDLTINSDGYVIEEGTEFATDADEATEEPFYIRNEDGSLETRPIGDSNPDFNMGFNVTFETGNFRLFTTLDWEQGADVYNYTRQLLYFNERHGDLDQTDLPEEERRPQSYYEGPLYNQSNPSSHFVEDASFLKLREVSVSYTFTNDMLASVGLDMIRDARISVLGRNLLTFTGYDGFDPEVSTETADQPANYKIDDFPYPNFRTFSASLQFRL